MIATANLYINVGLLLENYHFKSVKITIVVDVFRN